MSPLKNLGDKTGVFRKPNFMEMHRRIGGGGTGLNAHDNRRGDRVEMATYWRFRLPNLQPAPMHCDTWLLRS